MIMSENEYVVIVEDVAAPKIDTVIASVPSIIAGKNLISYMEEFDYMIGLIPVTYKIVLKSELDIK